MKESVVGREYARMFHDEGAKDVDGLLCLTLVVHFFRLSEDEVGLAATVVFVVDSVDDGVNSVAVGDVDGIFVIVVDSVDVAIDSVAVGDVGVIVGVDSVDDVVDSVTVGDVFTFKSIGRVVIDTVWAVDFIVGFVVFVDADMEDEVAKKGPNLSLPVTSLSTSSFPDSPF